jgi:hypothetical protein
MHARSPRKALQALSSQVLEGLHLCTEMVFEKALLPVETISGEDG